ncbi:hypothetical protein LINBF2_13180 [Limnohabitans sp. INBF002]|nr:hypothetical protein LINBF2_13180 [Limnohabitans sp. INBF002]
MRVDQHNVARRGDAAQDLAGLGIRHAVERGRLGIGLLKVDGGVFANVKRVPVDHRALAGLVDVEGVARLADGGLARIHLAASGQLGAGHGGGLGQRRQRKQPCDA